MNLRADPSSLTPDQTAAVGGITNGPDVTGLIGFAGTGKTYSMSALMGTVDIPILCAPTHKAAGVLQDKTGHVTTTAHSLLKLVPMPDGDGGRKLVQTGDPEIATGATVIVDEASMLPPVMLDYLMALVDDFGARIVLVGDPAQLPPVGYNTPCFEDWITRYNGRSFHLTEILRTADGNPLPEVASEWRPGAPRTDPWPDRPRTGATGHGVIPVARKAAQQMFLDAAQAHFVSEGSSYEVEPWLSYTNKAGDYMGHRARQVIFGRQAFTHPYIQDELLVMCTPLIKERQVVLPVSRVVRVTSPVVEDTVNFDGESYSTYTFEVTPEDGTIPIEITSMTYGERGSLLSAVASKARSETFSDGRNAGWKFFYALDAEIMDARTIYSSTTHKAQGSTYRNVFLDKNDMMNGYADPIRRALVYTAMTRPSETCYFVS